MYVHVCTHFNMDEMGGGRREIRVCMYLDTEEGEEEGGREICSS